MNTDRKLSTSFIIFLILITLLYISSLTYTTGHAIDDGIHIVVAKSLATGQGFHLISAPNSPVNTQFPPAMSMLLVPVLLLFPDIPDNIIPLKLVATLCALLYVMISWFWLRRQVVPLMALWLTILVAFNPETVRFSGAVMAEMGYAALSMLALLCFERYDTGTSSTEKRHFLILTVLTMTGAYFFRVVGLALIMAILATLIYRRRWMMTVMVAAGFLVLAAPWLFKSALVGTPEYRDQFWIANLEDPEQGVLGIFGLPGRAWHNAVTYVSYTIPVHLFPTLGSERLVTWFQNVGAISVLTVARLGLFLIVLLGFWRRLRDGLHVVEIYSVIYFGTLLIWHTRLHWKYMAPITPILALYMYMGLQWIRMKLPRIRLVSKALVPAALTALCMGYAFRDLDMVRQGWMVQGAHDPFAPAYGWIKRETPPTSLLMGIDHLGLYLYTGRKAIAPVMSRDHDYAMEYISSQKADYFIVSPSRVANEGPGLDERYLRPVIEKYPDRFSLMHIDPDTRIQIYRIHQKPERE